MKKQLTAMAFGMAVACAAAAWGGESTVGGAAEASRLLGASGLKGGLIVRVGGADGKLIAALAEAGPFVVQGLCDEPDAVAAAKRYVRSAGVYGKASVAAFDGKNLPYVDELVNLLLVYKAGGLSAAEVKRVLAPGGQALVKAGQDIPGLATRNVEGLEGWRAYKKPRPKAIDEWTHYLHDPRGTFVSDDLVAGHPRGLRWTGGPFWARSHEHTASMNAMVSAGGRVFYVMDEGPTDSIQLPPENYLTARDAFNGVILWKRHLHDWFNWLFPLKSGPGWLPRRLVAVGERLYIAPGLGQNLLCLDAATGKVVREYPATASTFELIVSGGVIFAAVDPNEKPIDYHQENANCWKERDRASRRWGWTPTAGMRVVKAIRAADGEVLWQHRLPVAPMTLAADDRMVCLYDGSSVLAFDRNTGKRLWRADIADMALIGTGYAGPRLVMCGDRVIFSPKGSIYAISTKTGEVLWTVKGKPRSGHYCLEDLFVLGDKIWVLGYPNRGGTFFIYSLADGKKLQEHRNPIRSFYIHQRCYPGRATRRYMLPAIMGLTVYDIKNDKWYLNHWVRGGCTYGLMPANGLVYTPPNACACYYQSKLNGFDALSPQASPADAPPADKRLQKGPAYGKCGQAASYPASAWPVFRHDNTRSGYARTDVPAELAKAWQKVIGKKLSQPVVAGGKLFVSAVDEHTVYALDAASGEEIWHFVAGGRVDSPPAIYRGMAIFGCADGCVYALRAGDGKLAWKFQTAPNERKLMAYGELESVWPVAGSVLILDNVPVGQDGSGRPGRRESRLYCVAGRSMFLDGGLRMVVLNPETGELIAENVMGDTIPGTDKNLQTILMGKHMPVAMPDILSSDGRYVYMKSQTFTLDGKRLRIRPLRPDTQYDREVHLFCPTSFLDDSWHQRIYWIYGRAAGEGWAEFQFPPKRVPCGRILSIDEKDAYAYGRDPVLMCNTSISEHWLYSALKKPTRKVGIPYLEGKWIKGQYPVKDKKNLLASNSVDWKALAKLPRRKLTALDYNWIHEKPTVMAKALVLANDHLFVAGPRDVVDEKEMWGRSNEPIFRRKMQEQADWLKGKYGGVLQVFSRKDGRKLAERKLDYLPAFDGLIAADGKLYMVTKDGSLVCYEGK
ncbi:MAG: PQQ-binding-like beta-propeller repeat protein [Planctomycetes bacterium]|nr:PQQ-binding-like beta-propeller repeat protein [Planctomycetota bacterium]